MPAPASAPTRIGLAPVVDRRTRLLILGSLPGEASLRLAEYYAHPRNAFWTLMSDRVGQDLTRLAYAAKLEALSAAGIGLWDVIARAAREGSLDQNIRSAEPTDLIGLVGRLPRLVAVAFNGGAAARVGRRSLAGVAGRLELFDLPSSSAAHTLPRADKARAWAALDQILRDD